MFIIACLIKKWEALINQSDISKTFYKFIESSFGHKHDIIEIGYDSGVSELNKGVLAMERKILVAYDGSELSEQALQEAKLQAAGVPETEVYVVAVVTVTGPSTHMIVAKSIQYDVADALRPDMEKINREFEAEDISITTDIVIADNNRNAGIKICEYADENNIDLIIAGSRGLGGMKKLLLGSVSHQIVQEAKCPVLIIK